MKMTIDKLISNLEQTIVGKERYRQSLLSDPSKKIVVQFLDANLTELKNIVDDVNKIKNNQ